MKYFLKIDFFLQIVSENFRKNYITIMPTDIFINLLYYCIMQCKQYKKVLQMKY